VSSFDQLSTRLSVGDTVWVTDAQGRELKGTLKALSPGSLKVKRWRSRTIDAAEIRAIDAVRHDSTRDGAVIGLAIGEGLAAVCYAAAVHEGEPEMIGFAELSFIYFGLVGIAIGSEVDGAMTAPRFAAYRAPGALGSAPVRLSFAPVITPRAKGVAISFAF
jgi:hypothetical protein